MLLSWKELIMNNKKITMDIYTKIFLLSNLLTVLLFIYFFFCALIGVGKEFFISIINICNVLSFGLLEGKNQENIPLLLFSLWIGLFITSVVIVSSSFALYAWAKKREEQKKLNTPHHETNENNKSSTSDDNSDKE